MRDIYDSPLFRTVLLVATILMFIVYAHIPSEEIEWYHMLFPFTGGALAVTYTKLMMRKTDEPR